MKQFFTLLLSMTSLQIAEAAKLDCEFRSVEIERDSHGIVNDAQLTRGPEQGSSTMSVDTDASQDAVTLGFRNYERKQGWTAKLTFEKVKNNHEASLAISNNRDDKYYTLARTAYDPSKGFQLSARDFFGLTTTAIGRDRFVQQVLLITTCTPPQVRTASK